MAQLDGGPQLQLHALLHRRERQQQERLAVDVLPENRARLAPRQGIKATQPSQQPSSLGPRREGRLSLPPTAERRQRATWFDSCLMFWFNQFRLLRKFWPLLNSHASAGRDGELGKWAAAGILSKLYCPWLGEHPSPPGPVLPIFCCDVTEAPRKGFSTKRALSLPC